MTRETITEILATECADCDAEEAAFYIAEQYGLSLRAVWNLLQRYQLTNA